MLNFTRLISFFIPISLYEKPPLPSTPNRIFSILLSGKTKSFTDQEKATIQQFATQLEKSINAYQYELLHSAWDNDLFKQQLGGLTSTDRTILTMLMRRTMLTIYSC